MQNVIDAPAYKDEVVRLKRELHKLEKQYDVPPMEEWKDMDLVHMPKDRLQDLFPQSFEKGKN